MDAALKATVQGIIVLLGSPNTNQGELYSIARHRCERAMGEYHQHPGWRILPTGGCGPHFNTTHKPHAHYLKQYLIAHGVPEEDILEFALSRNTVEDATLSYPIVRQYGVDRVVVVTSDFHGERAQYIFEREYRDVALSFALCPTDEGTCELDLAALKAHEKEALIELKQQKAKEH